MRIIISRKGFDSSSGGVPSPIFPDKSLLSLPIPDKKSRICYSDIRWKEYNLGSIVSDLTRGRITPGWRAHLDPDIRKESLPRPDNWMPIFGQTGPAQGHLRKNDVQKGDVFLFFGLFRDVVLHDDKIFWNLATSPRHVIWGWLQIGKIVGIDTCDRAEYKWAEYHPHFHHFQDPNNTLYIANEMLALPNMTQELTRAGASVFTKFSKQLQLTEQNAKRASAWELPKWFYPRSGRSHLSYHSDIDRWRLNEQSTKLDAVSRGQEFVLNCKDYPESLDWLASLFDSESCPLLS